MGYLEQLVFVGFNSRVVALNRDTGDIVWKWISHRGNGYTTVLLDGDRLIVSVIGYTYCLDPLTGRQLWYNELKGLGTGVTSLASVNGIAMGLLAAANSNARKRSNATTSATTTHLT